MARPSVLDALLLIIISFNLTAALPPSPQSLDPTTTPRGGPSIKNHPWHVYARLKDKICSGLIIHAEWVMLLEACTTDNEINSESKIEIYAGAETSDEADQVVKARVHSTSEDPLYGVTILHLETALLFDDSVQPARLPNNNFHLIFNGYGGVAAGFSTNGSADIHLQAFSANLYTLNSASFADERLYAKGNANWPTENTHTRGTDYLDVIVENPGEDGYKLYCMVGARKSTVHNSQLVEYYPTERMMPWFAKNLGLILEPNTQLTCGQLVYELQQ